MGYLLSILMVPHLFSFYVYLLKPDANKVYYYKYLMKGFYKEFALHFCCCYFMNY